MMDAHEGDAERPQAELDVVIANWNAGQLLRDCVAALAASSSAARLRVVVVDNASHDGSAHGLTPPGLALEVIRNEENRGFGAACNQGAGRGSAPFVLFLNPDTRVGPETLQQALDYLAAVGREHVGAMGVRLVDDAGRTQRTCAREPSPGSLVAQNLGLDRLVPRWIEPHFMVEWDHADTRPVDQVMGAFLLIRRSLFERVGGFDERYFVYYEDVDLCACVRREGCEVVHFAEAEAWHQGGGTTSQVKDRRLFYLLRSQVLYAAKWFGRGAAGAVLASALIGHIPLRVAQSVLRLSPGGALQALRGGLLLLQDLPRIWPILDKAGGPTPRR